MYKSFFVVPVLIMIGVLIAVAAFIGRIEVDRVYPLAATVTAIADDVVTVTDYSGNIWEFTGADGWSVGDVCAMVMDSKGTESITDDEIINCKYSGRIGGTAA